MEDEKTIGTAYKLIFNGLFRNGKIGTVELLFEKEFVRFDNLEYRTRG